MKTEINNENKAMFFAQYWGQYIGYNPLEGDSKRYVNNYFLSTTGIGQASFIRIKPLSSISDEDAIEVIRLCEGNPSNDLMFRDKFGETNASPKKWRQVYRFDNEPNGETIIANFSDQKDFFSVYTGNSYLRCHSRSIDYLRSKGYALPWMSLSVEEMVEYGWIKLV